MNSSSFFLIGQDLFFTTKILLKLEENNGIGAVNRNRIEWKICTSQKKHLSQITCIHIIYCIPQWARKLKKVEAKNLWNCIFDSFKLFPSSKIDFWPFKIAKNGIWSKKIICESDLFDFTSFFGHFLNFLAHCDF